ncbi:unnamed protein product [Paramecium sonneborni]|uniref:Transmembrane protein n=1 Tax=Paramecium sonneborni TaxID=65129 RepID=A0A8S1RRR1_9CILI|nr:unnamed protein product [Paramecium sonneborni]
MLNKKLLIDFKNIRAKNCPTTAQFIASRKWFHRQHQYSLIFFQKFWFLYILHFSFQYIIQIGSFQDFTFLKIRIQHAQTILIVHYYLFNYLINIVFILLYQQQQFQLKFHYLKFIINLSLLFQYTQDEQLRHRLTKITLLTRLYIQIDNPDIQSALFCLLLLCKIRYFLQLVLLLIIINTQWVFYLLDRIDICYLFFIFITFSSAFYPIIFEICFFKSFDLEQFCVSKVVIMIETLIMMILGEIVFRRGLILKLIFQLYIIVIKILMY